MADFIDNLVIMMLGEGEDGGESGGVEEKGKDHKEVHSRTEKEKWTFHETFVILKW